MGRLHIEAAEDDDPHDALSTADLDATTALSRARTTKDRAKAEFSAAKTDDSKRLAIRLWQRSADLAAVVIARCDEGFDTDVTVRCEPRRTCAHTRAHEGSTRCDEAWPRAGWDSRRDCAF